MAEAAIWAVGSVFWCSVAFIGVLSTFWHWWASPLGRAFVTFDIFMTITLGPATFGALFGWPDTSTMFWRWETIVGFLAIAATIPWKTWVIFRVQAGPEDQILTNRQGLEMLAALARKAARREGQEVP